MQVKAGRKIDILRLLSIASCVVGAAAYIFSGGAEAGRSQTPAPDAAATAASRQEAVATAAILPPKVELFDVGRGRVIRAAPNSFAYRRLGESWIASIESAWGGFRLDPESGYVLKIPFDPPVLADSRWFKGQVSELYLMWDPLNPHATRMMLIGSGSSPRVFLLKADAGAFVERFKNGLN